jgi:hypothetical protein
MPTKNSQNERHVNEEIVSTKPANRRKRYGAFGSLDKATRGWRYLPPVQRSSGEPPRGEELVFTMNSTTLEIGQGLSGFRGYLWPGCLAGIGVFAFGAFVLLMNHDSIEPEPLWLAALMLVICLASLLGFLFALVLFLNDLFGYADSPVRFDRARRKVYVWASRKEGPLELDWDKLKVVTQRATALPVQANAFKSVLLVDEDQNGDVCFEGRIPRIAQIGAMSLNQEAAMAQYEYVRVFMEQGSRALPAVQTHLVWRPRGWRVLVDIFGILQTWVHKYPQQPASERSPGGLLFATLAVGLFSLVLWPMQLGQAVAAKWGNRIPKWPKAFQELAAIGGPMQPPPGAVPSDVPMNKLEKSIGIFWATCGSVYCSAIAWHFLSK